ncbi:MAG: HAMP domain-containing sensor histidine kinase [bacterium]
MQKLYKQLEELVIKWKVNHRTNEFFIARLRLTFYYFITAIVILGGSSIILYNTILSNLTQSILEKEINPDISQIIIGNAQDIISDRFLTIDAILILFIVILGFLLTYKTLEPIKLNMEKQKRFIADASHELRTPTAVIISGLEVTLSNKKLDFSIAKKKLENTLEEMIEFSKLSNTLLDISKYDAPKCVECELMDVNKLFKSIVEKSEHLALSKKEITFDKNIIDTPVNILGSKVELSRLFYNILDNATKYSPRGEKVFISDTTLANKYIVTITDSGIGIPKNIINRIFDPFFRGDRTRTTSGAGLGLTLSKKIIENHLGTILIKSQENKGTSVVISLPIISS